MQGELYFYLIAFFFQLEVADECVRFAHALWMALDIFVQPGGAISL
jgi:hypothetical protein